MRRHGDRVLIGVLVAIIAVTIVVGQSVTRTVKGTGTVAAAVTIPGSDGTPLAAYVIPARGSSASSRAPLLIMPASWSSGSKEYVKAGEKLAAHGYEVVSYAQRGFRPSKGQVDFANATTQADVSTVIDWALAHTDADKKRIGAMGLSYGAGISLIAAERDPRIKAVVALAGWADLGAALDPDRSLNKIAVTSLMQSGAAAGNLDPELSQVRTSLGLGLTQNAEAMVNAPVRSAQTNVAALNKNKTAVMVANAYQDSLIAPNQLVTFFDGLNGPKRLELRVGDHGSPEITGLLGLQNEVWDNSTSWLDRYVRGMNNGVDKQAPVQLQDATTGQWHTYRSWPSARAPSTLALGAPTALQQTGAITDSTSSGGGQPAWSRTIATDHDTVANSGTVQVDNPKYVIASGVSIAAVDRADAMVWVGQALPRPDVVAGVPRVHLSVTSSGSAATFFVYLYDVDPKTGGALISYAPYSIIGAGPGRPQPVDVDLRATAWTVPAGHHLAIVIDTVDARYASRNAVGSTITFSSSPGQPAGLVLPTS